MAYIQPPLGATPYRSSYRTYSTSSTPYQSVLAPAPPTTSRRIQSRVYTPSHGSFVSSSNQSTYTTSTVPSKRPRLRVNPQLVIDREKLKLEQQEDKENAPAKENAPVDNFHEQEIMRTKKLATYTEFHMDQPSANTHDLLRYLKAKVADGVTFSDCFYIVNWWRLGRVIPLKHYGVVLKATNGEYLCLDLMRSGLLWNVAPEDGTGELPYELPRNLVHYKRYSISASPQEILDYCHSGTGFSLRNNCRVWTQTLMKKVLKIEMSSDEFDDLMADHLAEMQNQPSKSQSLPPSPRPVAQANAPLPIPAAPSHLPSARPPMQPMPSMYQTHTQPPMVYGYIPSSRPHGLPTGFPSTSRLAHPVQYPAYVAQAGNSQQYTRAPDNRPMYTYR